MSEPPNPAAAGKEEPPLETRATDLLIRLAFLGLLAYWSLELVRPFLPILIWAVVLAVALDPVYGWLVRRLRRPSLAAATVTLLVLATVIGPVGVLAASLAQSVQWIAEGVQAGTLQVPPPPIGVADWPLIGPHVSDAWSLLSDSIEDTIDRFGPAVLPAGGAILRKIAAIGGDLAKFVLSVTLMGFLFRPGPKLAKGAKAFVGRLVAPRGAHFVDLAGATIRNVSRGVIGVALLQTLAAGIVLEIAGVPGAGLFAFAMLILCIIQVGPAPVLLPVIVWAWTAMNAGPALVLTLVLLPVMLIDNVLKPILMARGLTTPLLVILTGVIGGTLSYGLVGLFLGPIVLAVFYELVVAWVRLGNAHVTTPGGAPSGGPLDGSRH
jgi:predicted PurR-regulated permease PerM